MSKRKCIKCGGGPITRRRAGVYSCKHCGVQPGPMNLDRGGMPPVVVEDEEAA